MDNLFWRDDSHPLNYFLNEKLKIFEDESHEFKQLSIKDKDSIESFLKLVSKYICAYLNSNSGCLYIGINDDGIVKGIELKSDILNLIKRELNVLITLFDPNALKESMIGFKFFNVYDEKNIKIDNLYVLEIFTKKGGDNIIYTTPYKDNSTKDYECFIKLNGTTHKVSGNQLQKYIKSKIAAYYERNSIIKQDDEIDIFED